MPITLAARAQVLMDVEVALTLPWQLSAFFSTRCRAGVPRDAEPVQSAKCEASFCLLTTVGYQDIYWTYVVIGNVMPLRGLFHHDSAPGSEAPHCRNASQVQVSVSGPSAGGLGKRHGALNLGIALYRHLIARPLAVMKKVFLKAMLMIIKALIDIPRIWPSFQVVEIKQVNFYLFRSREKKRV